LKTPTTSKQAQMASASSSSNFQQQQQPIIIENSNNAGAGSSQTVQIDGDKLVITPLGAGNEVGRSAVLCTFKGKSVLVCDSANTMLKTFCIIKLYSFVFVCIIIICFLFVSLIVVFTLRALVTTRYPSLIAQIQNLLILFLFHSTSKTVTATLHTCFTSCC